MKNRRTIPESGATRVRAADIPSVTKTEQRLATRDKEVIRRWAARHCAEPATGEATASGPATIDVKDGGAGIRFNFPAAARFRPISWEEWFENFDQYRLVFVYEEDVADRAYELWQHRGGGLGNDQEDWFEAERQLGSPTSPPMARYHLVTLPDDDT
jgi:Protein of unknown function (DUF2934)